MDQPSEVIIGKDVIKSYYSKFLDEGNKENF